jgi:hypothetical protein
MAAVETWQDAVTTAIGDLGIRGLGAIAFEALEAELPLLRDEPDLAEAARASVLANVALILELASGAASLADLEPPPAAVAFTRELARRNVPVAELDRAYRLAQHALWRWSVAEVRRRITDGAAVAAAVEALSEAAFITGDALTSVVMARYAAERERWVRSADAVRSATVEQILAGEPIDVDAASRRLRYELRQTHQAFVVWGEADDAVPETAAAAVGGPRALLVPMGVGLMAGWSPHVEPDVSQSLGAAVALGARAGGAAGFRRSHHQAMEARRVARLMNLRDGPVRYDDVALLALVTKDLEQARDFARRTLGPLAARDESTARLAETLFVVLEEQGSPRRAGRRLGVHENTVAKRLRAIDTLMEDVDPAPPSELLAALAIVRALPE